MSLVFVGRIKEERDYFEERAYYWREKSKYWMNRCEEVLQITEKTVNLLCEYKNLGSIEYIRKLVEYDKR